VEVRGAQEQEIYLSFSPRFEHIWLESKRRLLEYVAQKPANIGLLSQYALRLSAAIVLAAAGLATIVFERNLQIGGACSTAETTLPNFRQDLGSSVYPLGIASPAGLFCGAALKLSLMPSLAI
jgi:hypothetical protein